MIDAEMYGMIPSPKIVLMPIEVPPNIATVPNIFPATDDHCALRSELEPMLRGGGGISDLAAAPSGRIYITTSVQGVDRSRAGASGAGGGMEDKAAAPATSLVGGALWLVDLGCDARRTGDPCQCARQKVTLLETFIRKPDGVTHDEGSVLVVFDDEARRKSRQWAPKTFPLAQDEAVFAVVPSPEYK